MNDIVIFHRGSNMNEEASDLDFRRACSALPAGSIPVAVVVKNTLSILGSPDYSNLEILEYVNDGFGVTVTDEQRAAARSGRVHVFTLNSPYSRAIEAIETLRGHLDAEVEQAILADVSDITNDVWEAAYQAVEAAHNPPPSSRTPEQQARQAAHNALLAAVFPANPDDE